MVIKIDSQYKEIINPSIIAKQQKSQQVGIADNKIIKDICSEFQK